MHGSYGFLMYLFRLFVPLDLNAFYPYPLMDSQGHLPWVFRMAPFVFILVTGLSVGLLFRKNHLQRVAGFGMSFYLVMIALVLQFLSVGMTIMADRYTYLSYIGLFFITGEVLFFLLGSKQKQIRYAGYAFGILLVLLTVLFVVQTRSRVRVWSNDIALWTDSLEKISDQRMNRVRDKRARMYLQAGETEKALGDVLAIIRLDSSNAKAWEFGGRIYGLHMHDPDRAIGFLETGLSFAPEDPYILKALGVANGVKGNIRQALDYSLRAYRLDPADTVLIYNIIASYKNLGEFDKSREFEENLRKMTGK
jgi:protein O-mannosyl-transferase